MRIAILVRSLTGGGAERVAALWAEGFFRKGDIVCVFLDDNDDEITYNLPKGIIIKRIIDSHHNKIIRNFCRLIKLRKELLEFAPTVIIDVNPRVVKRISQIFTPGVKIATEHYAFERPKSALKKTHIWKRVLLDRTYSYITVLTHADYLIVKKFCNKVSVLPNPLPFKPIENLPPKQPVILAAGRLDAWHVKGFDLLLKAWAMICHSYPEWKLQIAGGGSENSKEFLKQICVDLGIEDCVCFLGFDNKLNERYQVASIFVLSSRYEGFGMVLIEAMSQGCACVASDYKGRQREIILNDSQGLLCDIEDAVGLSKSIEKLIKQNELRTTIQHNAVIRANDFTLDKIMERWGSIFSELQLM